MRSGQRSTKGQPGGGSTAADAMPLRTSIRSRTGAAGSGTAESSSACRGGAALQHALGRPLLDDLAGVHHEHVVGDVARAREVMGDVEERDAALLASARASG